MNALRRKLAHGRHDLYLAEKAITALSRLSHWSADHLVRVDPCCLYVDGWVYPLRWMVMEEKSTRARARARVRASGRGNCSRAVDDLARLDVDGWWDSLVADGG